MTAEAAVALDALTRVFGAERAVDGLGFTVASGELFGIVGPDGAGKTTTLRMLAGVLRPSAGDATIRGISVAQNPEGVKHHLAYMSQRFGLYTDLTVRENLDFYADLYGVPHDERPARLRRLYEFSGLEPFEQRLAGQLSGGMKQKLGLSCALVHQPDVLLLDEPTFGVDPISRRDLWLIIHEMVARGMTVLVSTAYMDEAERCDRVAFLDHGRALAIDTPDAVQRLMPLDVYAIRTDQPRRARDLLRRVSGVRRAALFGDTVHAAVENAATTWPAARRALERAGLAVLEAQEIEPSLEDVFIHLTQDADHD